MSSLYRNVRRSHQGPRDSENLCSNANKYTEHGHILLEICQTPEEPPQTIFRVVDTGTGIGQEHRERLFEAFDNAGNQAEGMGLGLYLSKYFVSMVTGRILVDSTPNEGSVFTVISPTRIDQRAVGSVQ